ncbi:MAG: hypothetical protein MAG581_01029 [Deltaproteobacteria bacterium]|jgi:hypothetical protein|nr:hypothetical protein [Deltaproteobacteria bacterium]
MKKLISILTMSLFLILSFGMTAQAQLAKKGKISGTFSFAGKVLGMHMKDKAPAFILAEFYGSTKNDSGNGIFHMNSFKCHFSLEVVQMPKTQNEGYCTFRDADGDTITFRASAKGSLGGPSDAKSRITHGTGKYKGITGSGSYKSSPVPAFEQGTFQGGGKWKTSYQIP